MMANATYSAPLIQSDPVATAQADAPFWPRFMAWSLDLAIEVALPYLVAVAGFTTFIGIRSLLTGKAFDPLLTLSDTIFPDKLWNTFKAIQDTAELDATTVTIQILSATTESIYVLPITFVLIGMVYIFNRLILPTMTGKTFGKQLMGLKLVNLKGAQPEAGAILLRHTLGQLLSSFFFLGYAYGAVSVDHRTWHDYIAGTRVVFDKDYTPRVGGGGTISSVLSHFGSLTLVVFFAYFLQLLAIWLRIIGLPIPSFLLPPEPPVATPIEFTFVEPDQKQGTAKSPTPPKQIKRIASAESTAGGTRDARRPVDAGSPGRGETERARTQRDPEPSPQPTPRRVVAAESTKPAPAPKPAPVQPRPTLDAVTTPEPAPASITPPAAPRTRRSQDLGEIASSDPGPVRRTRSSSADSLGGPLRSSAGSGPGGRGNSSLLNPDRTGPGQGIDASGDIDFGPYMSRLSQRVKRLWFAPEQNSSRRTVLAFTIGRNGELSGLRVQRSSGNVTSDEAAKEAIRRAAPFAPPPGKDSIEIIFTFDISVFGADYDGRGY